MEKRKVLFLTYYFPPMGGAGVQRSLKFARYLPPLGYIPLVIAGSGGRDQEWAPEDISLCSELSSDVSVERLALQMRSPESRLLRKLRRLTCMPDPLGQAWIQSAVRKGKEICSRHRPSLIYSSMSPFESAEVAADLSQTFKIPWVADLRDPWALDEMITYPSAFHRKHEFYKMRRLLSTASFVIMNTDEAVKRLQYSFPDLGVPVTCIPNGFDSDDFSSDLTPRSDGKFRIVHSGYLHTSGGITARKKNALHYFTKGTMSNVDILTRSHVFLVDAVSKWLQVDPEIEGCVDLMFIGKYTAADVDVVRNRSAFGLIQFCGYKQHAESLAAVRSSDVLFLPMHNLPRGTRATIIPGKAYEYIASGRPILGALPDGDAKDLLQRCGTGFVCDPDDVGGITKILRRLYECWREGRTAAQIDRQFVQQFERRELTRKLACIFNRLLS